MATLSTTIHHQLPQYRKEQIETVLRLLDEGNTIPFIARYRKEQTNALDEVALKEISDTAIYVNALAKRKLEILHQLTELEKATPALTKAIEEATQQKKCYDVSQKH